MNPAQVLKLAISKLEGLGIPYMIVGSFASSAYGLVRSTQDADLIIDPRPEQAIPLVEAFTGEFYVDAGLVEEAIRRRLSFNVIHLQTFFKIDLFVLPDAAFARQEFARRRRWPVSALEGGEVWIATPEDILLSKLRWYRDGGEVSELQWRDVIAILKSQGRRLDLPYLQAWAAEVGISDLLQQAMQEAGIAGD